MRQQTAFTLIEVLVVVAIIALLLALLLPTAGEIITQCYIVACASHLTAAHSVLMMYADASEGKLPPFEPYYGGAIFHPARQEESYEKTMSDVLLLKQLGAKADLFFCPLDPNYQSRSWRWNTWRNREYTASLGYASLINRRVALGNGRDEAALFADGRESPTTVTCDGDTPLMADNLRYRGTGQLYGWDHGGGRLSDLWGAGLFNSSCNTLYRGGYVILRKWPELEQQGPGLTMGAPGNDMWWFWLGGN